MKSESPTEMTELPPENAPLPAENHPAEPENPQGSRPEAASLEDAIRAAVFAENQGKYLSGECQGVGYKVFETFSDGERVDVYALVEYIEYGFQDGAFVNLSGMRARVLITFEKKEDRQVYDCVGWVQLDSMSGLSDEELEALMRPLWETGKDYTFSEEVFQELRAQADGYAEDYLRSIGRDAAVEERSSHGETALIKLGVEEDVYYQLVRQDETNRYPDWAGTCERLEDGTRYVCRTVYDAEAHVIEYTKTEYESREIVEQLRYDSVTGARIP